MDYSKSSTDSLIKEKEKENTITLSIFGYLKKQEEKLLEDLKTSLKNIEETEKTVIFEICDLFEPTKIFNEKTILTKVIKEIVKFSKITKLELIRTITIVEKTRKVGETFTGKELEPLKKAKHIKELKIQGKKEEDFLSTKGFKYLKNIKNITLQNIQSDSQEDILAQKDLEKLKNVENLTLNYPSLSSLLNLNFKNFEKLTKLNIISSSDYEDKNAQEMLNNLNKNTKLTINGKLIEKKRLKTTELVLSPPKPDTPILLKMKITDETIKKDDAKHIEKLDLSDCHLEPENLNLKNFTNLKKLNLSNTNVTNEFLKNFLYKQNLEELNLSGCHLESETLSNSLQEYKNLKKLTTPNEKIIEGQKQIQEHLKGLSQKQIQK